MAAINIDLSGIAQQIAAAVKQAVEKAAVASQPSFDIRAQIMANAQYLWPCARTYWLFQHPEHAIEATKSMSLIIQGTASNNTIRAQVVTSSSETDGCTHVAVFLEGNATNSPEEALDLLLKTTMSMIERDEDVGFEFAGGDAEYVENSGRMEVPAGRCDHCP
ncbi:hypothetical protein LTR97_004042 [Elasticomyces elasticus]|uniref:Uncharacterized protein n=1 Tax=Elasticomyces elasticus TaxID=574655 RepID=A0AAN7WDC4_9PEZI|nr:hypothetical protein LTR97_004042 [Elasticomyces elasticus]